MENKYKKLNLNWVTDIIGDDYYKKWRSGDVIKIKAQTGTGKTYFIKNILIDNMCDSKKMLILCNRVKLKRQLKKDLCVKFGVTIPKSLEELDRINKFNNVYIMSYQTLNELFLNEEYFGKRVNLDYDYIVCDEIHYITSDSFTGNTTIIWDKLIKKDMYNTIRIFISATMENIDDTINKCFEKNQENCFGTGINQIYEYDTGRDYSYLKPYYFRKIDTILNLIKNDTSKDKWMIFVSNKKDGNYIKNYLKSRKIKSEFLYSGKKSKEEKALINESKFNCKVLISTSVIDNGVNIEDDQVRHLVIIAWDEVTFLQEVGRIRFKKFERVPIISLYLDQKHKKSWEYKLKKYNKDLEIYNLYKNDKIGFKRKYNSSINELPNNLFYLDKNNDWKVDPILLSTIIKKSNYIEKIIENYRFYYDSSFIVEQLKLLGLEVENNTQKENYLEIINEEKNGKDLELYLNKILNKKLYKDDRQRLIDKINLRDDRGRQKKSISSMSKHLEENYKIKINSERCTKNGQKNTVWELEKLI